ncbi:hypothetical protein Q9Q95_18140 [Sphingomonas sp. DG1-23]|uniref:hypothetical protein n=1 Tax=Sphingomonas sp. DG1-23 TaxID=3068316 RepID=UPI00273E5A10|nr:hypothetical protein [Sphingomonas sp. DG1-23]MDP5280852.1 hypothetical protein [Sphingomonas sp. DG1-23]
MATATPANENFRLIGIIDPGLDVPGFVTPAFTSPEGGYYLANTANNLLSIDSFSKAEVLEEELLPAPESIKLEYRPGDANVFAFRHVNGIVETGTRPVLVERLKKMFEGLRNFPFSQLEVAGFINQPRFLAAAIRRSLLLETEAHRGSTRKALSELVSEFDLDERFARSLLALDFARALLTYYRLFNRLIHVADRTTRYQLTYRFRSATENIIPFLLDHSMINAFASADERNTQLELPGREFAATPPEFGLEVALRRLGVSATIAERYATRALASDGDDEPDMPLATHAVAAIESLKTLKFREEYKTFAIGRLDKKQRKRELDSEFMDLAFGLALVLSHELRMISLSASDYVSVRERLGRSVYKIAKPGAAASG